MSTESDHERLLHEYQSAHDQQDDEDDFVFNQESDNSNNWEDEEIDSYNIINNKPLTQNKQSNEWICHQCHFANNRLSAIQNDYKCCDCGHPLQLNDDKTYDNNNNIMSVQKTDDNKQKNNNDFPLKYNEPLLEITEEYKKYDMEHETNNFDIDLEIAKALQKEEQMQSIHYSTQNSSDDSRIQNTPEYKNCK